MGSDRYFRGQVMDDGNQQAKRNPVVDTLLILHRDQQHLVLADQVEREGKGAAVIHCGADRSLLCHFVVAAGYGHWQFDRALLVDRCLNLHCPQPLSRFDADGGGRALGPPLGRYSFYVN